MKHADPAWDFVVALYGRPGVESACLALQDRRGADVVVVLALIHCAHAGVAPAESALQRALEQTAWWQRSIREIREIRRSLRTGELPDSALKVLVDAERASERAELVIFLHALRESREATGDAVVDAARSLSAYWRLAGLVHDAADGAALAVLLAQAFPDRAARASIAVERAFSA